jgi:hypothetical protein
VALFFDGLHMEFGAIGQTRDATWRYISTTLRPEDRSLDFTGDRTKLHDALFRLGPHSRTDTQERQCPAIGEYPAYLIAERQDNNAEMRAAQIWDVADTQSLHALDVLEGVVNLLAARPGQRSPVLVSPGFLAATRDKSIKLTN